jgi:hypothetical protein
LPHVKEPSISVNYECASKILCIVPSFAGWGLSCVWNVAPLEMNEGTHWGQGYNRFIRLQCRRRTNKATFNLFYCTAKVGNPGGTYELPCIISTTYRLMVTSAERIKLLTPNTFARHRGTLFLKQ